MILGGMRNSLFTHHVLGGLRGAAHRDADGTVGVLDLFKHVSTSVRAKSQHPVMKADIESNFPVALARDRVAAPSSAKSGAARSDLGSWWPLFERTAVLLYPAGPQDQEIWSERPAMSVRCKQTKMAERPGTARSER
jgi:hypothetical protein